MLATARITKFIMKETVTLLADKVHEQELQHKEIIYMFTQPSGTLYFTAMYRYNNYGCVPFLKEFFLILVYCLF